MEHTLSWYCTRFDIMNGRGRVAFRASPQLACQLDRHTHTTGGATKQELGNGIHPWRYHAPPLGKPQAGQLISAIILML